LRWLVDVAPNPPVPIPMVHEFRLRKAIRDAVLWVVMRHEAKLMLYGP